MFPLPSYTEFFCSLQELKDAFYAEVKAEPEKTDDGSKAKKLSIKSKPVEDDPFASSEDEGPSDKKVSKFQRSVPKRKIEDKAESERPKKKTR